MASFTFLGRLGRVFESFGRWRVLADRLFHLFARASLDALLFGVNITVQSRFSSH